MLKIFQERKHECNIKLLDGGDFQTEVTKSTLGKDVMDQVCKHIGLEETDFFGLKYVCAKDRQLSWLDNAKSLGKQISNGPYNLIFRVKFYPPNPAALQEDITRYQLVLQVRDDLLKERLICAVPIYALLASYVIQAEKGDYDPLEHGSDYLSGLKFMPNQNNDFLERVKEFHKKHSGVTPAECDFHYLDNARKIPLYGMDLHDAFDGDNANVILGVSESGFHVIQKGREISKFSWSNVHKVYFKSKRFFLDIRVVTEVEYEDLTIGFKCRSRTELKRLYRSAIDHHTFFRRDAAVLGIQKVSFFKLGSRFRYSGRKTFQQLKTKSTNRVPPTFERVSSVRLSSANSSRKIEDRGEKRKVAKAMDKVPENHSTPSVTVEGNRGKHDDDVSPSISKDVLVVPSDSDSDKEQKPVNNHLTTVSINICPPTPTPPGTEEHKSAINETAPSQAASATQATTVESESESESVVKQHENETAVSTETCVVEQSSSSHTEKHCETKTTTTTITTTTEIITVDDETEEIVIVEEDTKTSTDEA